MASRWAALEHKGTRWRAIVTRWAGRPDVASLTIVDYPRFSLSGGLVRNRSLVEHLPSWLPDATCIGATVPLRRSRSPLDGWGWRRIARALDRVLPADAEAGRLVVGANPLWAPVLRYLPRSRTAFDAFDDWRSLHAMRPWRARVDQGYRSLGQVSVVSTNSPVVADRLTSEYGVEAVVESNGVDLAAFRRPPPFEGPLPAPPFAVYVGVIEPRVDVELLSEVVARLPDLPVVVAGPARDGTEDALRRTGAHWLGPVDFDAIPGLLSRAAVGLLPHHVNPMTESMNPLKLLEYLAAGLPVVATPVPGLGALSTRVTTATGADDFAAAIRRASADGRLPGPDPAVADRDWDGVAARLFRLYAGP